MTRSKLQNANAWQTPKSQTSTRLLGFGGFVDLKLGSLVVFGIGCVVFLLFIEAIKAQSYGIDWHTIDGGGGTSTGGVYSVSGTIGQPDASQQTMTGGNYSLQGGFWALYAVQTPGAPTLTIVPAGVGQATISWTPASTNWVLQENLNLATTNWVNSPSSWTNPIVVPATLPQKFYRLHQP